MRFWPDPHGYVSRSAILPPLAGVSADAERPGNAGPTVPARTSAPRSLNVTMIAERELGVAVVPPTLHPKCHSPVQTLASPPAAATSRYESVHTAILAWLWVVGLLECQGLANSHQPGLRRPR